MHSGNRPEITVSVLMPVKNAASTVGAAIRSTLLALPPDSELLVFDDGSTDESAQVIKRISDSRVSIHADPHHQGVAAGLNLLLEESRGRVIARMDADDITLPHRITQQVRELNRGYDLVFGSVIHFGARRVPRPSSPRRLNPGLLKRNLLISNPVAHSTMLSRAELIRELGGYRGVPAEDYDLWLRAASAGASLLRQSMPAILYRHSKSQLTAGGSWRSARDNDPVLAASIASLAAHLAPSWVEAEQRSQDLASMLTLRPAARAEVIGRVFGSMSFEERNYLAMRATREAQRLNHGTGAS